MLNMLNRKKDPTLQELDAIELDRKERISHAVDEIDALQGRIEGLRMQISDGNLDAKSELQKVKARIADLKEEVESHETALSKMPALKNRARGILIEALIPRIRQMDDEIDPLVDDISRKVDALNAAHKKLLNYLDKFNELDATGILQLKRDLIDSGLNVLFSIPNPMVPGSIAMDETPIDLDLIMMAGTYDKNKFLNKIEKMREGVAITLNRMSDHARVLKGDGSSTEPYPYCPYCYQYVGWANAHGITQCGKCGKTF